jgi:rhomboid protease GluP
MSAADTIGTETFASYVARYFMARKGFSAAVPLQATELAPACDILLTRTDGIRFEAFCIVDHEANPHAQFGLAPDAVRAIARKCLELSGHLGSTKMPIGIYVIEIGPGLDTDEHRRRLKGFSRKSIFDKAFIGAMILDTSSGTLWTNAPMLGRYLDPVATFRRLLKSPRTAIVQEQARPSAEDAVARSGVAYVTYALLAILVGVFAAECVFALGPLKGTLQPSITTLEALGGSHWTRIVESGEWYRLLSASFLHGDLMHLLLNGFVLFYAGRRLEWVIGHAWFAAIYLVSAVCGSIASLAINPHSVIGVGASGAIMGILSASVISSLHFAAGPTRTRLQVTAVQVLIPSLLPIWTTTHSGMQIDLGAHLGGAIGGALIAGLMLLLWPRSSQSPRFTSAAIALAIIGTFASVATLIPITRSYARYARDFQLAAMLIPTKEYPSTSAAAQAQAETLVSHYPNDPRAYFLRGSSRLKARNYEGAAADFQAGLDKQEVLDRMLKPIIRTLLQANLAVAQNAQGKYAMAKGTAKPVCAANPSGEIRQGLDRLRLCD